MPVFVDYRGNRGPRLSTRIVRVRAERMLAALRLADAELSVLLCDGTVMRALNRRHRGADYATDVLAFAMEEDDALRSATAAAAGSAASSPVLLGDIVISIPTATRQARAAGKEPLAETTMLLAHGLLHLLGLDHRNPQEERCMLARTDILVSAALTTPPASGGQLRGLARRALPSGLRGGT